MRKKLLLTLILAVATVTGLQAQGWTVTPGEGVGALTLGMARTSADAVLKPTEKIGIQNNPQYVRYGPELLIEYNANKAIMISLHSNSFQTKNGAVSWVPYKGAAVGVPWTTVVGQLPANKVSQKLKTAKGHPEEFYHAYTGIGLGFRVKAGTIVQVDVWNAK